MTEVDCALTEGKAPRRLTFDTPSSGDILKKSQEIKEEKEKEKEKEDEVSSHLVENVDTQSEEMEEFKEDVQHVGASEILSEMQEVNYYIFK